MEVKRVKVKLMLWEHDLKNTWLISSLAKKGIKVDKSSLCEILSGRRTGKKAELVIDESLTILKKYEQFSKAL